MPFWLLLNANFNFCLLYYIVTIVLEKTMLMSAMHVVAIPLSFLHFKEKFKHQCPTFLSIFFSFLKQQYILLQKKKGEKNKKYYIYDF